jgi:hypothetical protein
MRVRCYRRRSPALDGAFLDLVTALRKYKGATEASAEVMRALSRPVIAAVVADTLLETTGQRYSQAALRIAHRLRKEAQIRGRLDQGSLYGALARLGGDYEELVEHVKKPRKMTWEFKSDENVWIIAAYEFLELARMFWEARDGRVYSRIPQESKRFRPLLRASRTSPEAPTGSVVSKDHRTLGTPSETMLEASRRLNQVGLWVREDIFEAQQRVLDSREPHPMRPWRSLFKKAERSALRKWNDTQRGRLRAFARALHLAKEVHAERVWYPSTYFDYRGRVYYRQDGLMVQGQDSAKALVRFKEPYRVTKGSGAWDEMLRHLANKAGWSHLDSGQKVVQGQQILRNWVREGCPVDVSWASDPWQTLGVLQDLKEVELRGSGMCSTIVQIDGRCNGLQLYGSLCRDERLMSLTNVTGTTNKDLYSDFATLLAPFLETSEFADFFPELRTDPRKLRKLVKVPLMATPYGISMIGIRDLLAFWGAKQDPRVLREVDFIAGAVKLAQEICRLRETYLEKPLALMRAIQNLPLESWENSTGFQVHCSVQPRVRRWVKSLVTNRTMAVVDLDFPQVEVSEIAPNLIHSLDANIVHLVGSKVDCPLVTVHDCFGTTPHHIPYLRAHIEQAFKDTIKDTIVQLSKHPSLMVHLPDKDHLAHQRLNPLMYS